VSANSQLGTCVLEVALCLAQQLLDGSVESSSYAVGESVMARRTDGDFGEGTVLDTLEAEARDQRKLEERLARAKWLILPDSKFLIFWLSLIGPLIVYNVIWVPLEVSQMARSDRTHGQIDFILDFFFYIDIAINFRTAFHDKENELILDWKQISKRYFYGYFFLDFVATVQWEVFSGSHPFKEGAENSSGGAFQVLRLPRLLRLLRLFKKLDKFPQLKIAKVPPPPRPSAGIRVAPSTRSALCASRPVAH
jgi:hypothetical protein